jgi:hypothetical protein
MTSGTLTCVPTGGVAGAHSFSQGTANTPPNNSVGFQAPTSVPAAYLVTMPSAPAAGYVKRTGANPSVESVGAIAAGELPTSALTGIAKYLAGVPSAAAYADITGLWTTCSSGYLKYDGTCTTPSGGGTVTSSGTPLVHQVGVWTSATDAKGLTVGTDNQVLLGHTGADPGFGVLAITHLPAASLTRTACFDLGADNASADLLDADIGPQGRIWMLPVGATIMEITIAANAGTPKVMVTKNVTGGAQTNLLSAALTTASAGGVACSKASAATGLDGVTTCSATLQNNTSLAAGTWIETATASSYTSSGAKRISVCTTYTVN